MFALVYLNVHIQVEVLPLPLKYRCQIENINHIRPLKMATIPLGDLLCVLVSLAKSSFLWAFFD